MPDFERMFKAYQSGLRQLSDDLATGLDPTPEERDHLRLLSELLEGVVDSYASHWLTRVTALDASTSVMYAESTQTEPQVLNVPVRSLVDNNTLAAWQARYLHGVLGLKHSVLVTGPARAGKSTLLNSLLQLIPVDQRLVAIEEGAELPALKTRSFTVNLTAKPGTTASATAIRKAAGMKPTWILAASIGGADAASFFEALTQGISGLATVESADPAEALTAWVDDTPEIALNLRKTAPIAIVQMDRDGAGRPRVMHIFELSVDDEGLGLRERRPS